MISEKLKTTGLLVLLGVSLSFVVILKINNSKLNTENSNLREEKKKEIEKVRDSALVQNKILSDIYLEQLDSIKKVKQKIKYIPYEKYRYIDRSLDVAIDILSNYTYEGTTKKDSTGNNSRKIN